MPKRLSIRTLLVYGALIAMFLIADPRLPTFAVGCVLAVIGIGIRVWGCGHLEKNRKVVTSGPYAHVQHPLYLGSFLIAVGGIIAAGSPGMPGILLWTVAGPLFLLTYFVFYMPRKKATESARLLSKFPEEYGEYARAVPKFVPSPKAWTEADQQTWRWRKVRENHEIEMDLVIVALFAFCLLSPSMPWR